MSSQPTVLLLGATGRTGGRVLAQLLSRGIHVRAIVRSKSKLPAGLAEHPNAEVIEGSLLSVSDDDLERHVRGCDAVICCLGHVLSIKGIWGPPYDLVTRATSRLCRAIEAVKPATQVKLALMTSVSVHHPAGLDTRRFAFERAVLAVLRALVPPANDNQRAANFLIENIGSEHAFVQWAVVRPDTLIEGDVTDYAVHEQLVSSLFAPANTNMANVAHLLCELATNPTTWQRWRGKLPVVINATAAT